MGYLTDSKGNQSSTRLVMFLWSIAVLVVWCGVCIYKREMVDIPMGVGAIVGYALGAKAVQSFAEKPVTPTATKGAANPNNEVG